MFKFCDNSLAEEIFNDVHHSFTTIHISCSDLIFGSCTVKSSFESGENLGNVLKISRALVGPHRQPLGCITSSSSCALAEGVMHTECLVNQFWTEKHKFGFLVMQWIESQYVGDSRTMNWTSPYGKVSPRPNLRRRHTVATFSKRECVTPYQNPFLHVKKMVYHEASILSMVETVNY
jgi:hypothetical protein